MNQTLWTPTELRALADAAAKSGLLPPEIRGADAAFYIMASGQEIGLPPTVSLRMLRLVKGKVSIAAETMIALAISRGIACEWRRADNEGAVLVLTRPGGKPYTASFTMDDARKAKLDTQETWQKYGPALLRARCASSGIRAYCPEVVMGLYTPEEVESFGDPAPRTVQIEARLADAKPSDLQARIKAAVADLGLEGIVGERWGMDEIVWTSSNMREIGALTKSTRETKAIAAESAAKAETENNTSNISNEGVSE